ncbi:cysteine hydrolase family protein [Tessaracoccus sp. MC1756]|uniref:cysteine hydrolase family protein n=1 Tax=Tessaracoccus sp. MC1756 TaxID=2760311 RepID=UPI0016041D12|nr:isochorismatase family cysteine hydrolase [Tessaracoccus sp. MC1756]MBB1509314.1 cysteine hydrolase [Tessaracoccus sp. MC1756]
MSGDAGLALVVIDLQKSYFELPGLAGKEELLLPPTNELIASARANGRPVILVRTQHEPDKSTWTLNMLEDDQGFAFPGSEQAEFLDGLDTTDYVEIVKTRDNAFFGTNLKEQLDFLGIDRLLICGVSTHSCVAQTAIGAFAHNFRAYVAGDAIASDHRPLAEALLDFLREEMRQPVLTQRESLDLLAGS